MGEDAFQFGVAPDLAHDVARDPAEIGADRLQRPVRALELFGVGIALMNDQRMFADPLVGLAQLDASFPGQPHHPRAWLRPFASQPTGFPGSARQAAPPPSAGASASATSGRRSSLCWKNSSPCMDGPGFARTLTFRPTGRLRSCIRPLAQPDPTAGLDGIRKPDALSQNRTQGARRGTGLIEPGCRPSAITSLSFASRSSLNSFPDCPGLCRQFACVICGEKEVPRDMIAQAIRASLFAIATATILGCRRPIRAVSQADGIPWPRRVQRKTA